MLKTPQVNESKTFTINNYNFDEITKKKLAQVAASIRNLTIDAVHQAGSGHAGTPLGCAEIGAYLYGYYLKYNPKNLSWLNRDRFILSAGHASLLQYTCLYLNNILTIKDLKQFRQLNSKTPSHPQYKTTEGIETTTGVDGQGIAHGVGQALGIKLLGSRFNKNYQIFDAKVIVLAGDGCFMEGVSHEACSIAGHLKLDNLILIYDKNKTCLDGYVSESCSEDTAKRYEAYGWDVYEINGHDFDSINDVFRKIREKQEKPTLVIANTIIGKLTPNEGSYLVHNGPLSIEERKNTKELLGVPNTDFFVPEGVFDYFIQKSKNDALQEKEWNRLFLQWSIAHPSLYKDYQLAFSNELPNDLEQKLFSIQIPSPVSGRKASHAVVNYLADILPNLYGGSADLARSDMTHLDNYAVISSDALSGRNIKYGVREFGMAGIAIGLAQTNLIRPFIGTFLAFSDYMLNGIRLAALMKLPIIYQLTHDSIFIGQDGPTHQPIEQLAHLRSIPNLRVIRPADANEVKMAWLSALSYQGPTAIVLSREPLPLCQGTDCCFEEGLNRGAYIIKEGVRKKLNYTLISTGSQVSLTIEVAYALENLGHSARVVSMPCWDLFELQSEDYKKSIFGKESGFKISIEAASEIGWHKYVLDGKVIGINSYGKSATSSDLAEEYGFTLDSIVNSILKK